MGFGVFLPAAKIQEEQLCPAVFGGCSEGFPPPQKKKKQGEKEGKGGHKTAVNPWKKKIHLPEVQGTAGITQIEDTAEGERRSWEGARKPLDLQDEGREPGWWDTESW